MTAQYVMGVDVSQYVEYAGFVLIAATMICAVFVIMLTGISYDIDFTESICQMEMSIDYFIDSFEIISNNFLIYLKTVLKKAY